MDSEFVLEDDILSFQETKHINFISWKNGLTFTKPIDSDPLQEDHASMIMYWNFYHIN